MNKAAKLGHNFTGAQMSPEDTRKMVEYVDERPADMPGDASALAQAREQMKREEGAVGSVPIPGSVKGMLKSTFDKLLGNSPELLIDKLGERLAFERTGVRLYEALIAKAGACATGSELIPTLKQIRDDEEAHMFLLIDALESLGADPTAQTPCADLAGVVGSGALKVITDPRTNLAQALNAMLTVELTDNAAWEMLIKLTDDGGHANIGSSFTHALTEEQRHLNTIRSLLARELGVSGH